MPEVKVCTKCGEQKPLTEFYSNRSRPDGLASWCKAGVKDYDASPDGRAANRRYQATDKGRAARERYRATEKGQQTSHRAFEHYQESGKKAIARAKWRASESGQISRAQYENKARSKKLAQQRVARYRVTEKRKIVAARYRATEKGLQTGRQARRRSRARKAEAEGTHTFTEFLVLCEAAEGRCLGCGKEVPLTEDHIMPLALGGSDDISNIQPLCKSCNSRKGAKIVDFQTVTEA